MHMASSVMISHLPQLLLPQRLASITSVEMIWKKNPRTYTTDLPNSMETSGLPAIYTLMNVVESAMPNLRRLSITLDCDLTLEAYCDDSHLSQDENKPTISTPIDDMVRRMGAHLEECHIFIPYHIFEERAQRADKSINLCDADRKSYEGRRFWRELPPGDVGNEAPAMNPQGYWVCRGIIYPCVLVVPCFQ